ncbi:hypothetical protein ARMGADRAFT_2676 [Armillaria gallica]|uniref:HMG box domain-containing protein n=1 Tax=Armillaria gallica TaxID=47427 RepID=A0A2H3E9U5_ARMGA|nr:hypothetical protein ARMGADRAFT_2676 [Armillaria gallica]
MRNGSTRSWQREQKDAIEKTTCPPEGNLRRDSLCSPCLPHPKCASEQDASWPTTTLRLPTTMDSYEYEHDDDFVDDDLPPLVESTSSSYIPRPPNAFILFRSAFIRSQRISGRVEGNHSTLSKIIGMYWRALPHEEKQEWEAKAKVALEEHRRRYPDWRFRPGVNGGRGRGRGGRGKRGRGRGGEGDGRGREKREREDGRLGKIRDLLVEGREGEDLERAVNEWERERDRAGKRSRHRRRPDTRLMTSRCQLPLHLPKAT